MSRFQDEDWDLEGTADDGDWNDEPELEDRFLARLGEPEERRPRRSTSGDRRPKKQKRPPEFNRYRDRTSWDTVDDDPDLD